MAIKLKSQSAQKPNQPQEVIGGNVSNLVEEAKQYNDNLYNVPEIYKKVEPANHMILVKLRMADQPSNEIVGFNSQTNAPRREWVNWHGEGESKRGVGIVISGGLEFGTRVIVSPNTFYTEQWLQNGGNIFTTPEHKEEGYFLIPRNFVLGIY